MWSRGSRTHATGTFCDASFFSGVLLRVPGWRRRWAVALPVVSRGLLGPCGWSLLGAPLRRTPAGQLRGSSLDGPVTGLGPRLGACSPAVTLCFSPSVSRCHGCFFPGSRRCGRGVLFLRILVYLALWQGCGHVSVYGGGGGFPHSALCLFWHGICILLAGSFRGCTGSGRL